MFPITRISRILKMPKYSTAAAVTIVRAHTDSAGVETLSAELQREIQGPYRTAAAVATAACLVGAIIFLFYNEKEIMGKIRARRGEEKA